MNAHIEWSRWAKEFSIFFPFECSEIWCMYECVGIWHVQNEG